MKTINGYQLDRTCGACPEQYDVYKDFVKVGYLRLRHGWFYATIPDCSGERVYEASPEGDGIFEYDERERYLTEAVKAIDKAINKNSNNNIDLKG